MLLVVGLTIVREHLCETRRVQIVGQSLDCRATYMIQGPGLSVLNAIIA